MPYSQGSLLQALGQNERMATAPLPLDKIRARRSAREAERLAEFEAQTKRIAATSTSSAGQAASAKEARLAAGEAETKKILLGAKGILTEKDTTSPRYAIQMQELYRHLYLSGDPGAIKVAEGVAAKLDALREGAATGPTTHGRAADDTSVSKRAAANQANTQAALNSSLITKSQPAPTEEAFTWANSMVSGNDPGKSGWAAMFKRNYSQDELTQKSYSLAAIYDRVKRNYAIANNYAVMPENEAQAAALAAFEMMEQGQGGTSPVQPNQQPQQSQQGQQPALKLRP